jgi:hypothetical protein
MACDARQLPRGRRAPSVPHQRGGARHVSTPYLGYTLSTLVISTALYRAMGGYRWAVALLIGGVTTGALYLMFRVWLLEPLPTGWVGI